MSTTSSLVIGVDEFHDSSYASLPGARADALRMARALGSQSQVLIGDASTRVDRLTILCCVRRWLHSLANSEFGILYIASHGVRVGNELVVCAHDSESHCQLESGIPASTLWRLVRMEDLTICQLIFIFDVCQSEGEGPSTDELPPNVTCITTAPGNGSAYEISGQGQFSNMFEKAIRDAIPLMAGNGNGYAFAEVLQRTKSLLEAADFPQAITISGANCDRLSLVSSLERETRVRRPISMQLVSRPLKSGLNDLVQRIEASMATWLGMDWVEGRFVSMEGINAIKVYLPAGGLLDGTCGLVEAVLTEFHGIFKELRLQSADGWSRTDANKLARSLKANVLPAEREDEFRASWHSTLCDGHVCFNFKDESTLIIFSAGSLEVPAATVDLIGNQLRDLVNFLINRRLVSERTAP